MKKIRILIYVALLVKVLVILSLNQKLELNPDESRNYQIALNSQQGKGYTILDPETGLYKATAYHASFPVFVYELMIRYKVSVSAWMFLVSVCSLGLYALSIRYFYKLALFFLTSQYALAAAITYSFYPSVLVYIGGLISLYENAVLSVIIITTYWTLRSTTFGLKAIDHAVLPLLVTISCLFRPSAIPVFVLLFSVYSGISLYRKKPENLWPVLVTLTLMIIMHVPVIVKNRYLFNAGIISTQSGYELLQGHNPTARGSWRGDWQDSTSVLYQYVHAMIPDIDMLNEYEEGLARKTLALRWISENPLDELILASRKLAIYFLPYNYEVLKTAKVFNPVNFIVHLLFAITLLFRIYRRNLKSRDLIILSPVIASIVFSLVYFVGYRWRYYAEPFLIIYAWIGLWQLVSTVSKKPVLQVKEGK